MKRLFVLLIFQILVFQGLKAQNAFKVTVKDSQSQQALAGVTVMLDHLGPGEVTDTAGKAIIYGIKPGEHNITLLAKGFITHSVDVMFPMRWGGDNVILLISKYDKHKKPRKHKVR